MCVYFTYLLMSVYHHMCLFMCVSVREYVRTFENSFIRWRIWTSTCVQWRNEKLSLELIAQPEHIFQEWLPFKKTLQSLTL